MSTTFSTRRKSINLKERVASPDARVDESAGVIRGVKIIGESSRNRRRYTKDCLRRAIPKYEGVSVFVNHPEGHRENGRDLNDKIGWLENVHMDTTGLRGDLHLLQNHPMTARTMEAARRNPGLLGLSHNAVGQIAPGRGGNDEVVVEDIEKVVSVDLVSAPATTGGLFESTQRTGYSRFRDSVRGLSSIREATGPNTGEPKLDLDDDFDGEAFATGIRKRSTEAALTALSGEIGKAFEKSEGVALGLMDTIEAIRKILDTVEAAIDDDSTMIADDATESLRAEVSDLRRDDALRDLLEDHNLRRSDLNALQRKTLGRADSVEEMEDLLEEFHVRPSNGRRPRDGIGPAARVGRSRIPVRRRVGCAYPQRKRGSGCFWIICFGASLCPRRATRPVVRQSVGRTYPPSPWPPRLRGVCLRARVRSRPLSFRPVGHLFQGSRSPHVFYSEEKRTGRSPQIRKFRSVSSNGHRHRRWARGG